MKDGTVAKEDAAPDADVLMSNSAVSRQGKALDKLVFYQRAWFWVWGYFIASVVSYIYTAYDNAANGKAFATLRSVVDQARQRGLVRFSGTQVVMAIQTPYLANIWFVNMRLPEAIRYASTMRAVDFTPELVGNLADRADGHFKDSPLRLVCEVAGLDVQAAECLQPCPLLPSPNTAQAISHVAMDSGLGLFIGHTVSNVVPSLAGGRGKLLMGAAALLMGGARAWEVGSRAAEVKKQCQELQGTCRTTGGACE